MNYYGGEIDKATNNNAYIYKRDYSNYEAYIGDKITEAEKLKNYMDADIIESEKITLILTQEK
jgi:hypothetical protein